MRTSVTGSCWPSAPPTHSPANGMVRLAPGRRGQRARRGAGPRVRVLLTPFVSSDIGDVPRELVHAVREWYRVYKVAEGKAPNRYALNGEAVGKVSGRRCACACVVLIRRGCRAGLCARRGRGVPSDVAAAAQGGARRGHRDQRDHRLGYPCLTYRVDRVQAPQRGRECARWWRGCHTKKRERGAARRPSALASLV
jgi:hypothetical protein